MIPTLSASLLAPLLALQAAPAAAEKPATLADVPIEQATAPRCGIAFAVVQDWQAKGDPRGAEFPALAETRGREFFVVAMARLMDSFSLEQADVTRLVQAEVARHGEDGGEAIASMMPACLALMAATTLPETPAE